ncbi:sacsin N-terminal ATP-binding-like domain-containing protein [Kitasatospora griseola]|uniref:sacsin N-terminal ATP-binding-like domain-containing protein n=1 Tax=Kitasatospora griseola TaxID=2064 RepID=UPI0038012313
MLREWQATPTWQPAQQLRAVSLMSARDYAGRFLLELLQNGHDAHPADRTDGQVHVLLDEREGPYGTLYVANAGGLFGWEQVERVCKFARSDKRVGDGIGNKGLGFRSVLEVAESPEIYSDDRQDGPPGRLDGYRFRFATADDLRTLLGNEALAEKAEKEFPPLQLPFPIDELPSTCRELGEAGHVTVIRLVLRSGIAREQAARRLKELARARTPVMLFLGRLGRLVLERRKADGAVDRTELVRQEEPIAGQQPHPAAFPAPVVSMARVALGELGEFLVARGVLPERRLRRTLAEAVENGSLDQTWNDWQEEAAVEIALPLGTDSDRRGQYYTFLPLGDDVAAPLRGHVNAPFFTKMDRTALDREHPLNAMLLDAVAETCLLAAEFWRAAPGDLHRRAAVDILGWEPTAQSAGLLSAAARRVHRRPFAEVPLVPVLDAGAANAWRSPGEAVLWSADELVTLTAEAAGAAGIPVADPAVGPGRLRRLARICAQLKCPLEPGTQGRADHVERIVATLPLPGPGEPVALWDGLYTDLAHLFALDHSALRGRRLLLTDGGTLGRCNGGPAVATGKGRREAFFPPARADLTGDSEITVPDALRKRLFYLHPGLACVAERGERGRASRFFLEQHGLVRTFDVHELLEHVRLALGASPSQRLRAQSLKFVFRLHRTHPSARHWVRSVGLYVPTAAGPSALATSAVFGAGWDGTHGDDLAAVVAEGQQVSVDLRWTVDRLIAPPSEFVGRKESAEEWRAFLIAIGVRDGLLPVLSKGATSRANGNRLDASNLVRMAKVSAQISAQWAPYVDHGRHDARYPQTPYVGTPAWRLPGQDVVTGFSEPGRLAYARLVLHGLSHWDEEKFASRWTRDRSGNPDPRHVLTPLAAFVREQPWLPVRGRAVAFARPADAWHYRGAPEEEPAFLQTVARSLRARLDGGHTLERLRRLGMPTWDRAEDSALMLTHLGRLVASGGIGAEDRPVAQRANQRAWKALTGLPAMDRAPQSLVGRMAGGSLLIESGQGMATVAVEALRKGERRIYVTGRPDSLTVQLLRETEHSLLVVPDAAQNAAKLLRHLAPKAALLVEEAKFAVEVDDGAALAQLGRPLVESLPWLPLAMAALADHVGGGIRPDESTLTALVSAVRAVRLHGYRTMTLGFDGHRIELPERLSGVLPVADRRRPLVLAPAGLADPLDWDGVGALTDAAAQAVRQSSFAVRLRLAAHELRGAYADVAAPDDHALAAALHLTPAQLQETRQRLDGSVGGILERCLPVLVHLLGEQRARDLTDPPPASRRDFLALLTAHEAEFPVSGETLLKAARTARDVDELRAALGIGFAEFNVTLAALAPQYGPTSRAEEHEEAVRRHVDLHRTRLVDRLRWARLACFDRRESIPGWPGLRSLSWLTAPGSWALTVEQADAARLRAHVEAALAAELGHPAPDSGDRLPALELVRARNAALARRSAAAIATLIKAARRPLPPPLAAADPAPEFQALLDDAGALDFRQLDEADLAPWLAALGHWPAGMPLTLDPADHGLAQEDLDRARDSAEQARAERLRRQRVITFGSTEFDVSTGDFTALVDALERMVAQHSGTVPGRKGFTALKEPKASSSRRPGAAGPTRPGRFVAADRGLSAAQREAIGFVGEWIAYQWLREHHRTANEDSWVSANRRNVFPGSSGDDTLGYDFSVGSGRHPLLFEVKATQGDGGAFELGPSEVKAAQRHSGSDRWRILAVTNVLDPAAVRVDVLPNPFAARGRGRYREEGGALRFSYWT